MPRATESPAAQPAQAGRAGISVIIPAYNEAQRLPRSLVALDTFLRTLDRPMEVLVVDNGSTDGTAPAVEAYAAMMPYLRVLSIVTRGKGIAARTGILAAQHDYLLLCDADFSMPPEGLAAFIDELDCGAPIVIGSREGAHALRVDEPALRHFMGRVFNRVVQLLAVGGLQDTQCGFKGFRRDVARPSSPLPA